MSEEEIIQRIEKLKQNAEPYMGSITELLFDLYKLYKKEKEKNIQLQKKSFNDLYHIENDNGIIKIGANK